MCALAHNSNRALGKPDSYHIMHDSPFGVKVPQSICQCRGRPSHFSWFRRANFTHSLCMVFQPSCVHSPSRYLVEIEAPGRLNGGVGPCGAQIRPLGAFSLVQNRSPNIPRTNGGTLPVGRRAEERRRQKKKKKQKPEKKKPEQPEGPSSVGMERGISGGVKWGKPREWKEGFRGESDGVNPLAP